MDCAYFGGEFVYSGSLPCRNVSSVGRRQWQIRPLKGCPIVLQGYGGQQVFLHLKQKYV